MKRLLFAFLFITSYSFGADANNSIVKNSWYIFDGTIGYEKIRLAFYLFENDSVKGKYVLLEEKKTIAFSGLASNINFNLKEDTSDIFYYTRFFSTKGQLLGNVIDNINDVSRSINLKLSHVLTQKYKPLEVKSYLSVAYPSGHWVSRNYYDKLRQFKSPRLAQDSSRYVYIPRRSEEPIMMIYNFHESIPFKLIYNKGKLELREIENDSVKESPFDSITVISKDKIMIGSTEFVNLDLDTPATDRKILEEILFRGYYEANRNSEKIQMFYKDGRTALSGYKYYKPVLDYYDAGLQIDLVDMVSEDSAITRFGFKFKKDILELYKVKCIETDNENKCVEIDFGELVYSLKRVE
jgi:hypothetical protein